MYIDLKLRYFDICNKFIYLDETSSAHVIFNSTNVPTYSDTFLFLNDLFPSCSHYTVFHPSRNLQDGIKISSLFHV